MKSIDKILDITNKYMIGGKPQLAEWAYERAYSMNRLMKEVSGQKWIDAINSRDALYAYHHTWMWKKTGKFEEISLAMDHARNIFEREAA